MIWKGQKSKGHLKLLAFIGKYKYMYNNENNLIMKTMCPPAYHRSGFVATLGHMMYGLLYMYKYKYIYIYIYIYI